jgi:hypothetical protein
VVDAGEVVELEGAAETLDPPAVALLAHGRPVVQRVAPQLADGAQRVGRRAGADAPLEELRVRADVSRTRRDVDRDVAEEPDAAVGGIASEGAPLAVEAHLAGDGAVAGEGCPVGDPVPLPRDVRLEPGGGHPRGRLLEVARVGGERRGGRVR